MARNYNGTTGRVTHGFELPKPRGTVAQWLRPNQLRFMAGLYESDGSYNGFGESGTALETHIWCSSATFGYHLQDGNSSNARFSIAGTSTPSLTKYSCVIVTWDRSGFARLYVNGRLEKVVNISGGAFTDIAATVKQIGRVGAGTTARHWDGDIGETSVYDRVLDWSDIINLSVKRIPAHQVCRGALRFYMPDLDGATSMTPDLSGGANVGTGVGTTRYAPHPLIRPISIKSAPFFSSMAGAPTGGTILPFMNHYAA